MTEFICPTCDKVLKSRNGFKNHTRSCGKVKAIPPALAKAEALVCLVERMKNDRNLSVDAMRSAISVTMGPYTTSILNGVYSLLSAMDKPLKQTRDNLASNG
jgi:hypothetical protein